MESFLESENRESSIECDLKTLLRNKTKGYPSSQIFQSVKAQQENIFSSQIPSAKVEEQICGRNQENDCLEFSQVAKS